MSNLLLYDFPDSICSQMARLALVEKGLTFDRQTVDIMNSEQFDAWYMALNPAAVVPTLRTTNETITDTIRIVNHLDRYPGPDLGLAGSTIVQEWMHRIMALHYGVLLYSNKLNTDRTSPTMIRRAANLAKIAKEQPELSEIMAKRLAGNQRLQATMKDADLVAEHVAAARGLVKDMDQALTENTFLAGKSYSLADCFATAALARFKLHGFESWWQDGVCAAVENYYQRMQSRESFGHAGVVDA